MERGNYSEYEVETRTFLQKESRESDNKPWKEVKKRADRILAQLSLEWKDLVGKKVLDVGSGSSKIERVARKAGIDSVFSLDRKIEVMSTRPELKGGVNADMSEIPLRDNSVDLIIANGTSISQSNEEEVGKVLREFERVLSRGGEARIFPPRQKNIFNNMMEPWVKEYLLKTDKEGREKASIEPTAKERIKFSKHEQEVFHKSTRFLQEKGFDITLEENDVEHPPEWEHLKYYWSFKKSEN